MKLLLHRKYLKDSYTIGRLYIDRGYGQLDYICDTLEDKVRDTNKDGDLNDIGETKVYGETAIPYGTYEIDMDVVSPKFSKYEFYKCHCGGKVPRLKNVPHFEGILIHCAEGAQGAKLVQGCIGVGLNKIKGGLIQSKQKFVELYTILDKAHKKAESISITIV
jgi:hypothetical protein